MVSERSSMDLSGLPAALAAERASAMATPTLPEDLPPGVENHPAKGLIHRIPRVAEDGSVYDQLRPVALTIEEAKERKVDYYHPRFGWLLNGYKLATDRTPQARMADGSVPAGVPQLEE